jgi:hypothetical protein
MAEEPLDQQPVTVYLDYVGVGDNNNVYARFKFEDSAEWMVEWAADSEEADEILGFFSQLVTRTLARVAERGVAFDDFTPPEEDDDE